MYVSEATILWINQKKEYIKESTYAFYSINTENYIIPYFGDIPILELTNQMVQDTINYWQYRPDEQGKGMRWSTIRNILSLLKQIINFAKNELEQNVNISEFNLHPINTTYINHRKVWSIKEQQFIVNAALKENSNRDLGIIIAISCGLRIGEICALQWSDIDISAGVIYIRKTLQRIYLHDSIPKSRVIISTPKTQSSIREIPISKKLKKRIVEFDDKIGSDYVLTNSSKYMEPRAYRKYFKKFLLKYNIDNLNFHCLRHSFATRCISSGSDIKVVSDLLGHATVNTTWNMYVHPSMQEKQKCIDIANII